MSIVTITLNNRDFKLSCPEENHKELYSLAEKLDLEINKIKQSVIADIASVQSFTDKRPPFEKNYPK